jgi:hypothetical protein
MAHWLMDYLLAGKFDKLTSYLRYCNNRPEIIGYVRAVREAIMKAFFY